MTTVHVDLRQLSGLPADAAIPFASFRVAPFTDDAQVVRFFDGVGEFDTDPGAVTVAEWGFRGARIRHLTIPAGTDIDYGDLTEETP